ncbi:hypothetical protein PUNSTDRAFT_60294 [Punctularia strigosozonata HHB-11173 SS5]|uniref:uncharacterized protein n=1 Tax=Punctularia strigosozonata (strain HHB-11173) TaxID=741275 RepID=UPI000441666F|nr:uncharacterized protein PUNSTDRAFT_60294 [Punctularia strigosozonata HHB-11173 SS5]EIN12802.1 hypothetical protein PUNSTDRAFT_60294 [Punctularia strigosozonata HHB-11173 SS5]
MLSAKAKGKQKAIEPDAAKERASSPCTLVVRFTEGDPDLRLEATEQETIRDAKPHLRGRRLRLIHQGRLLPDTTPVHNWLSSTESRHHTETSNEPTSDDSPFSAPTTWVHCSIGPVLSEGEEDQEKDTQTAQIKPLRGFDRLAAAGFSESDIQSIRRQFHSQSTDNYLDSGFENDDDYEERARVLEEQWIDSMDTGGSAALSDYSPTAIVTGAVMGFFFPLLPFFFFSEARPAVFWEDGSEQPAPRSAIFSCVVMARISPIYLMDNVSFSESACR